MKLLLLTIIIVVILIFGMAIGIMFSKRKKFPDTHVGHNPNMKKLGISCAKSENMGNKPIEQSTSHCGKCEIFEK